MPFADAILDLRCGYKQTIYFSATYNKHGFVILSTYIFLEMRV